jgi:hypothetical protein
MYDTPTATHALFELLQEGPYPLRIHVSGSGYVRRAIPVAAAVGPVMVQDILPHPDGEGFTGVLAELPTEGDALKVGWLGRELVDTGVVYGPEGNV